jgi:hypothetical protein
MSYQIAKARLVKMTFVKMGGIALAACDTGGSELQTLTVYNLASDDAFIQFEQPGGVGDKILWRSEMQTESGMPIGLGSGHCVQLDAAADHFCSFVIDFDGRGTLAGQGVQLTEPERSVFPITGGTGEFEGVTGVFETEPVENRARYKYVIRYR